jgi:D-apiose dehydrogenase
MSKKRFAFFGAGWFAHLQLAGWYELPDVQCVAIYNRTRSKGEKLAAEFKVPKVYDDPEKLFKQEKIDFVDIATNPFTLSRFVLMAARYKVPVICQKPMAPSVAIAKKMVNACRNAGVPFLVHENWRWQAPIRQLKSVLDTGVIGKVFRARIRMVSGRNVFVNEPTLSEIEKFILTDMGSHILDVARFLFGEADRLYCETHRVHPHIKGEDVATVIFRMGHGQTTVTCEMGYPENHLEHDYFPQTMIFVEGDRGSAEISGDYWVRVTTRTGTQAKRYPPICYPWSDPGHELVDSSIVSCQRHLLKALYGKVRGETTGEDNLKTIKLVYACYNSASKGKVIKI